MVVVTTYSVGHNAIGNKSGLQEGRLLRLETEVRKSVSIQAVPRGALLGSSEFAWANDCRNARMHVIELLVRGCLKHNLAARTPESLLSLSFRAAAKTFA